MRPAPPRALPPIICGSWFENSLGASAPGELPMLGTIDGGLKLTASGRPPPTPRAVGDCPETITAGEKAITKTMSLDTQVAVRPLIILITLLLTF